MKKIKVGHKEVGEGCQTFIVAEIGYNFNTLDEAKRSVKAAKECGADAVKFQTFRADTIVTKDAVFPLEGGGGSQYEEFKKYELSEEWHKILFDYARKLGLIVFSTPSHSTDLQLLESLKVEIYKVGSDDLTNLPFLEEIARLGKPMIVSTGMATLGEVEEAVETILQTGNDQLILLHCLSNYPIKRIDYVNLRAMKTLAEAFNVLVGYSDHTTSFVTPVAAVALGACVYERHFTIDKNLPAPDAPFSADPVEMKQIVQIIRETEAMLGNGIKKPAPTEIEMRQNTRKSLVSKKYIKKGEKLTPENVTIKRPGNGIPPKFFYSVIGRCARIDIPEDKVITWGMLEPE